MLEALSELLVARPRHARLTRELRAAGAALKAARDADVARQLAVLREQKRAILKRLVPALRAAAVPNRELMELEDNERQLCGESIADPLAWHELSPETSAFQPRLARFEAALREQGLIE